MSDLLVKHAMINHTCPDCNGTDFRPGPRGGLSQNIECRQCKARFNVTYYENHLVYAERIHAERHGGPHWREDWFPQ